jgi:hypothetical protein
MRTIKTYFKGAPFYIALSYRNVAQAHKHVFVGMRACEYEVH